MRGGLYVKLPLFLSDFDGTSIFSTDFEKKKPPQIFNLMKKTSIGTRFVTYGRTDRQDETSCGFSIFGLISVQYTSENSLSAACG
jgi:hypothetical protein